MYRRHAVIGFVSGSVFVGNALRIGREKVEIESLNSLRIPTNSSSSMGKSRVKSSIFIRNCSSLSGVIKDTDLKREKKSKSVASKGENKPKVEQVPRGSKLLVVGLGNPGKEYEMTRHNVGFQFLDIWAARLNASKFKVESKYSALISEVNLNDSKNTQVFLMKPSTYMNLSGQSVKAFCKFHKIPSSAVLVVVDEVNVDFGKVRLREKGSAGGHNGLKSIQQSLGTQEYPRLRIGLGRPNHREDLANFVLAKFTRSEQKDIQNVYM